MELPIYLKTEISMHHGYIASGIHGDFESQYRGMDGKVLASLGIQKNYTRHWVHVVDKNNNVVTYLFNYKTVKKLLMDVTIEYEYETEYERPFFPFFKYFKRLIPKKKFIVIKVNEIN